MRHGRVAEQGQVKKQRPTSPPSAQRPQRGGLSSAFSASSAVNTSSRIHWEILSIILIVSLQACGKGPPPPPAPPPSPAEPALPPLADLKFPEWSEAEPEEFTILPAAGPVTPAWNFKPGRRYAYDYAQVLNQRSDYRVGETSNVRVLRQRNRGTFEFVAGRDRSAFAYLRIETEEQVVNDLPVPKSPKDPDVTSLAEAILKEDGAYDIKKQRGQADMRLFFEAILRLGPGEKIFSDGSARTSVAGRFKVGRYECLRIESEFEFTARKPSDAALLRGRAVGFFDPAEGRFVRSSTAVSTSTRKNELRRDEEDKKDVWLTTVTEATTTIRLQLLENP